MIKTVRFIDYLGNDRTDLHHTTTLMRLEKGHSAWQRHMQTLVKVSICRTCGG